MMFQRIGVVVSIIGVLTLVAITTSWAGTGPKVVVVYTSVDQVYAEPIFKEYERQSAVKVLPVYDVEAAKTTGLVNRLIAEKNRPQADVFWSSESVQTLLLKEKGVLARGGCSGVQGIPSAYRDSDETWVGFAGRARVLLVNTRRISLSRAPQKLEDLLKAEYKNNTVGLAYPLFGTAATQAAALYASWGQQKAQSFFQKLQARGVRIVEGNSVVRDLVVNGQLDMGLTDTDDALGALRNKATVTLRFLDQDGIGTLMVPNTVGLIAGAKHSAEGQKLIRFLASKKTEQALLNSGSAQFPVHQGLSPVKEMGKTSLKMMQVSFDKIYRQLERSKRDLMTIFIR